ncbi:MAG: hypothetical protein V7609_1731 [Verrucomicrobiota bacterium]
MDSNLTSVLAIWGAALSTLTFLLQIAKWRRERPRIAAEVETYDVPAGGGIRFAIRNRGDKPTTIEEVTLLTYQPGVIGFLGVKHTEEPLSGVHRRTAKLPAVVGPGEIWRGEAPFSGGRRGDAAEKLSLIQAGSLFYKIRCAHSSRLKLGKVRLDTSDNPFRA